MKLNLQVLAAIVVFTILCAILVLRSERTVLADGGGGGPFPQCIPKVNCP